MSEMLGQAFVFRRPRPKDQKANSANIKNYNLFCYFSKEADTKHTLYWKRIYSMAYPNNNLFTM